MYLKPLFIENMTLIKSKHGSKAELSDKFMKQIERSGVIDNILNFMKFKQSAGNKKMSGTKTANVVIDKLDDATEAGKKNSKENVFNTVRLERLVKRNSKFSSF